MSVIASNLRCDQKQDSVYVRGARWTQEYSLTPFCLQRLKEFYNSKVATLLYSRTWCSYCFCNFCISCMKEAVPKCPNSCGKWFSIPA